MTVASAALAGRAQQITPADYTLGIAAYTLEVAPRRTIKTIAYNRQVPGPLLRFKEGQPVTIDVTNQTGPRLVDFRKRTRGQKTFTSGCRRR